MQARAVWDYHTEKNDELRLTKNEIVVYLNLIQIYKKTIQYLWLMNLNCIRQSILQETSQKGGSLRNQAMAVKGLFN